MILTLQGGAPTESGGVFTYVYNATLQAGAQVEPNDFFTLYDFAGLGSVDDTNFTPDAGLGALGTFSFGVSSVGGWPRAAERSSFLA